MADSGNTTDRNAARGRKLTSINLSIDTLAYLDGLSRRANLNRSKLIELIICEFKDSGRVLTITIS